MSDNALSSYLSDTTMGKRIGQPFPCSRMIRVEHHERVSPIFRDIERKVWLFYAVNCHQRHRLKPVLPTLLLIKIRFELDKCEINFFPLLPILYTWQPYFTRTSAHSECLQPFLQPAMLSSMGRFQSFKLFSVEISTPTLQCFIIFPDRQMLPSATFEATSQCDSMRAGTCMGTDRYKVISSSNFIPLRGPPLYLLHSIF